MIWRPAVDAPIWSKFPDDDATAPYWYRVDRVGNVVTCSISGDGERWHPLDQRELNLGGPIHLGLVVCSHDPDTTATVRFDEVSVLSGD